jgi:putative ABC transport system permease protein
MKTIWTVSRTAVTAVTSHKLRSFLTILGVVIGVAAVIILMSVGKGTESKVLSNLTSLGTNVIYVQPGSTTQGGVRSGPNSATTLTLEDSEAIAANIAGISYVAPYSTSGCQVIAGSQNMFARVTGVTPDYETVYNLTLAEGSFIDQVDYQSNLKTAVIGPNVSATLFEGDGPLGQTIRLGSNVFKVIGVLESKGTSMMGSTDDAILVPLSTLQGMLSRSITTTGGHIISSITLQVLDKADLQTVKDDITYLLQTRHAIAPGAENDFTVTSMDDLTSTVTSSMQSLTLLLGAIAGISLLVGGIGVMNIMLVSVMERRREIGVRKALGAKERDIWGQFLIDSALLTFAGGVVGVAIGWGGSYLVNSLGLATTLVTSDIVVLAVSVSVAIGLFFGFYPAWQGSRLDPIQALRAE